MLMESTESQFTTEIKQMLSGSITDPDIVNYLAYKITEIHETYNDKQSA